MKRHGPGWRPTRPDDPRCACGQPGHITWLGLDAQPSATTCCRDLPECEPTAVTP